MLMTGLTSLNAGIHARLRGSTHLAGQTIVAAAGAPMGGLFAGGSPLTCDEVQQIAAIPHVVATQAMLVAAIPTTARPSEYSGGVALIGTDMIQPVRRSIRPAISSKVEAFDRAARSSAAPRSTPRCATSAPASCTRAA
jgi:hypothetical protein